MKEPLARTSGGSTIPVMLREKRLADAFRAACCLLSCGQGGQKCLPTPWLPSLHEQFPPFARLRPSFIQACRLPFLASKRLVQSCENDAKGGVWPSVAVDGPVNLDWERIHCDWTWRRQVRHRCIPDAWVSAKRRGEVVKNQLPLLLGADPVYLLVDYPTQRRWLATTTGVRRGVVLTKPA